MKYRNTGNATDVLTVAGWVTVPRGDIADFGDTTPDLHPDYWAPVADDGTATDDLGDLDLDTLLDVATAEGVDIGAASTATGVARKIRDHRTTT